MWGLVLCEVEKENSLICQFSLNIRRECSFIFILLQHRVDFCIEISVEKSG